MDLARVSFKGQRRKDGSTCSWCKLVGVRSPEAATLTHCGACWKKRRVKILYCGRRCQREAWPQHRVECAAGSGCWSPRHPRLWPGGSVIWTRRERGVVMEMCAGGASHGPWTSRPPRPCKKTGSARDVGGDAPVEFRADLCSRPLAAGWRGPSGFDLDWIAVVASVYTCLDLRELRRRRNAVVRSHARAERSRAVAPFPRAPAVVWSWSLPTGLRRPRPWFMRAGAEKALQLSRGANSACQR